MLGKFEFAFGLSRMIKEHTAWVKASKDALAKAYFDQPALTSEDFGGEFTAVLPLHGAFDYC